MNKENYLQQIDRVIAQGPYCADWASLCRHSTPEWYKRDKFGIFIHWGIYSVPAFMDEWYPRNMYRKNSPEYRHHVETYGPVDQFGYKDFIPMFQAEKFDADQWLELFQQSGARFIMPVAEHHDGFQMYKSELSHWNSVEMGPHRDILAELKEAAVKRNIQFTASSHRAEHWWFFNNGRRWPSDVQDEAYRDFYGPAQGLTLQHESKFDNPPNQEFLEDWLVRSCELVDRYRPGIAYFDLWIQHVAFKPYLKKFAAYYYNRAVEWGMDVTIASKADAYPFGSSVCSMERGQFADIQHEFWESDTSVGYDSWGYTEANRYKTVRQLVCDLVDVVSKNGGMILNIGPKADGTIDEKEAGLLRGIGRWLEVNGEAIYDTHPWRVFGEGPTAVPEGSFNDAGRADFTSGDVRYTMRGSTIYATVMRWPEDGRVRLHELGLDSTHFRGEVAYAEILGHKISPIIVRHEALELFAQLPPTDLPVVIRLETV